MRLIHGAAVLVGALMITGGVIACGDDDDGNGGSGGGGTGGGAQCTGDATFDCTDACANLESFCDESACGSNPSCQVPDCVSSCTTIKETDLGPLEEAQKKAILGLWNCLDDSSSCLGFASCVSTCNQ